MKKMYYLATCDTCKRIIKELELPANTEMQDIKSQEITLAQLEELKKLAGTYEALFTKRAKLYKERNLKNEALTERDYKQLILEHYTFLKRPVLVYNNEIFIGNSKKVVASAKAAIHSK